MTSDDRNLERLSAYHDGEVSERERAAVDDLLNSSVAAGDVLKDYREMSRLLGELPREELGDDFTAIVLQAAERKTLLDSLPAASDARQPRRRKLPGLAALGCTLAAMLILISVLNVRPLRDALPEKAKESNDRSPELAESRKPFALPGKREVRKAPQFGKMRGDAEQPQANIGFANKKTGFGHDDAGNRLQADARKGKAASWAVGRQPRPAPSTGGEPLVPPIPLDKDAGRAVAQDSRLVFIDDLKRLNASDVGKVVTAFEKTTDGVAVVKLTVVDCSKGLQALQVLLTRNAIQRQPDQLGAAPQADGQPQMVAVYVQATRRQLTSAIEELKNDNAFRALRVEPSIPLALLDLPSSRSQSRRHQFAPTAPTRTSPDAIRGAKQRFNKRSKKGFRPTADSSKSGTEKAKPSSDLVASQLRKDRASADLAELERISRQLSLSLPPRVLQAMSESPRHRQKSLLKSIVTNSAKPRALKVLFVLQYCRPANSGTHGEGGPLKPVPAKPAAQPQRNGAA